VSSGVGTIHTKKKKYVRASHKNIQHIFKYHCLLLLNATQMGSLKKYSAMTIPLQNSQRSYDFSQICTCHSSIPEILMCSFFLKGAMTVNCQTSPRISSSLTGKNEFRDKFPDVLHQIRLIWLTTSVTHVACMVENILINL
jgi:hypothetical protein